MVYQKNCACFHTKTLDRISPTTIRLEMVNLRVHELVYQDSNQSSTYKTLRNLIKDYTFNVSNAASSFFFQLF
jgi:hypothetical protein